MQTKSAIIRQVHGTTLIGKADSNHWVTMDTTPAGDGEDGATSPKELLLLALGGCTSMDVISILQKKRAPLTDYELRLTAELSDEYPQVFTTIHIEYIFSGSGVTPADVERAIELSETKYCAVTAMLRASVKISSAYKIIP